MNTIRQQRYVTQVEQPRRGIASKTKIMNPLATVVSETQRRYQAERQKPLFGDTPTITDGEETELNKVSIPVCNRESRGCRIHQ